MNHKKYPCLLEYSTSKIKGVEKEDHWLHVKDEEEALKLLGLIKKSCWEYEQRNVGSAYFTSSDGIKKKLEE